ncbi:hypothetical protein A2U01_0011846 [Trifolium medium]|uniref:Uncharacterized protein n=1 Tax=Trifolium medium TaxID=97028 RepID=A0A392MUE3_9FABA|nr:hypothetical protein [Trifolium medium]
MRNTSLVHTHSGEVMGGCPGKLNLTSSPEICSSEPLSIDEEILVLVETLKSTLWEDMDFIISRYHEVLESLDHLLVVDVPAILKSEKSQSEFEGDLTAATKKQARLQIDVNALESSLEYNTTKAYNLYQEITVAERKLLAMKSELEDIHSTIRTDLGVLCKKRDRLNTFAKQQVELLSNKEDKTKEAELTVTRKLNLQRTWNNIKAFSQLI